MAEPDLGPTPEDIARQVIDENRFMVLGTVGPDGAPRVSPVYYNDVAYRRFYWVSSPDSRHSLNIAVEPRVELVIFDSQPPAGAASAVYLGALATEVPTEELDTACAEAFRHVRAGASAFSPDELFGTAPLRLYRADVRQAAIHVRGSDPVRGKGVDTRWEVQL